MHKTQTSARLRLRFYLVVFEHGKLDLLPLVLVLLGGGVGLLLPLFGTTTQPQHQVQSRLLKTQRHGRERDARQHNHAKTPSSLRPEFNSAPATGQRKPGRIWEPQPLFFFFYRHRWCCCIFNSWLHQTKVQVGKIPISTVLKVENRCCDRRTDFPTLQENLKAAVWDPLTSLSIQTGGLSLQDSFQPPGGDRLQSWLSDKFQTWILPQSWMKTGFPVIWTAGCELTLPRITNLF